MRGARRQGARARARARARRPACGAACQGGGYVALCCFIKESVFHMNNKL